MHGVLTRDRSSRIPVNYTRLRYAAKRIRRRWQLYIIILLPLIYLAIFKYIPMYGLQIAFRDYSPALGFSRSPWAGLSYFKQFFTSPYFGITVGNTLYINLLGVLLSFPFPIVFALALNEAGSLTYKKTAQLITYAPHFISVVVIVQMVLTFLSLRNGVINHVIEAFGGEPIQFMAKPALFPYIFVLSGIWQNFGFSAIIYIAALASINHELYEAAYIDGASRLQKVIHIDVPGIAPTIIILLILRFGRLMELGFEKVFLMQNPLNLSGSEVIATYVYKVGVVHTQYSFGTAVGLFNALINLLLIVLVNRIARRVSDTSLW